MLGRSDAVRFRRKRGAKRASWTLCRNTAAASVGVGGFTHYEPNNGPFFDEPFSARARPRAGMEKLVDGINQLSHGTLLSRQRSGLALSRVPTIIGDEIQISLNSVGEALHRQFFELDV